MPSAHRNAPHAQPDPAPRNLRDIPRMRRHPRGPAVVRLSGEDFWLGRFGSRESFQRYGQVVAEWQARGCRSRTRAEAAMDASAAATVETRAGTFSTPDTIDVAEIVERFLQHADQEYRRADGTPTGEAYTFRQALRPLVNRFAGLKALDFGPQALKDVRESMVRDEDWCRNTINQQVRRIKVVFKWAKNEQLIASSVFEGIRDLEPLRQGRCKARETVPVKPVPRPHIDQVLPFLSRQIAAMVQLQLLSGARSGEICGLRAAELRMEGAVWIYEPAHHKTAHHGKRRRIGFGPRAQDILRPFLVGNPNEPLFKPADANRERNLARRKGSPARWKPPEGAAGKRYTPNVYRWAIARACDKAFPPPAELAQREKETAAAWRARLTPKQLAAVKAWQKAHRWHPHQLRHNAATDLRGHFGIEGSRIALGHSSTVTTETYADRDEATLVRMMAEVG